MHNNFPDPVNEITISNNSSESKHQNILLTGSKHGTLQMYTIDDSDTEIKVDLVETMLITDLDKSKQINSISIINEEHNFCVGMDSGTLDIYNASHGKGNDGIGLIHRISRPDEGDVTKT